MPMKLDLPDPLYTRLHKYSVFANLPVPSLIERWADYFEAKANNRNSAPAVAETPAAAYEAKRLDPLRPPDLFHTRARGTFGSAAFSNWNDLVRTAHIHAFAKAGSFEELRKVTHAQIRKGSHSDSGYHALPDIGISVQGVDANHAWTYSLQLAKYLGTPIRAFIEWRHNEKAAYPGEQGILEWNPRENQRI
jgi:hypothetical protein